ncbi:MAG: YlbF family regulator [Akkermansiaceae bacterium]|nr:YlbF family regulator [Akkermansiaceae bacterium]
MTESSLTPELMELTTMLCNALAANEEVAAAKARIDLFSRSAEATRLFHDVNAYGEELRAKYQAGMSPSEEEIAKFDGLRQAVVDNELAHGFLEAHQRIDEILGSINQLLSMTVELGRTPSLEEFTAARSHADESCGRGGDCSCHDGGGESCGCRRHHGHCHH